MEFRPFVLLFSVILASGRCEEIPRCCGEKLFEAVVAGNQVQFQNGSPLFFNLYLPTGVDVDGERSGIDGYLTMLEGESYTLKTIQLWKEGKQYTIFDGVCTVTNLTLPKPSACISDDATFVGYFVQGKNEFVQQSWSLKPSDVGLKTGQAYVSVSNATCVPTSFSFAGIGVYGDVPTPITSGAGYFNYTSGIKDPKKWFDIPSSCKNQTVLAKERSASQGTDKAAAAVEVLKKWRLY